MEAVLLYIYSDSNYKECIFRCYVIEKKFYIINILNFSTYYEKKIEIKLFILQLIQFTSNCFHIYTLATVVYL